METTDHSQSVPETNHKTPFSGRDHPPLCVGAIAFCMDDVCWCAKSCVSATLRLEYGANIIQRQLGRGHVTGGTYKLNRFIFSCCLKAKNASVIIAL